METKTTLKLVVVSTFTQLEFEILLLFVIFYAPFLDCQSQLYVLLHFRSLFSVLLVAVFRSSILSDAVFRNFCTFGHSVQYFFHGFVDGFLWFPGNFPWKYLHFPKFFFYFFPVVFFTGFSHLLTFFYQILYMET